jgi:hypothetical protein
MQFPLGDRPAPRRQLTPEEEQQLRLAAQAAPLPATSGPRPPIGPHPAEPASVDNRFLFQVVGDRPQARTPQQEPSPGADVGVVPVSQRYDEVLSAAAAAAPASAPRLGSFVGERPGSAPTPPPDEELAAVQTDFNRAQEKRSEAFNRPTNDRNGRLRSILKMAGVALQQFNNFRPGGNWGEFARTAVGAGGIVFGTALHPSIDEEMAREHDLPIAERALDEAGKRLDGTIDRRSKLAAARLKETQASGYPDVQDAKQHAQKLREVATRLRVMGGTYTPNKDKVLDSLVEELGASPKRGGSGFNAQRLKVVGGNLVYVEHPDLPPVVLYTAGMSEADHQRNAVALEQVNTYRYRQGLPPLMFTSDLSDDLPVAPPPLGSFVGDRPAPAVPAAAPAPVVGAPASPVLSPIPGAKVPPAQTYYGGRGGGGRHRSGGSGSGTPSGAGGLDKYEESALRKAENDSAQSRARAATARSRGDDAEADAHDEAARVADETAAKLRQKGGITASAPAQSAPRHPSGLIPRAGNQYTEAEIRAEAQRNNVDPDAAVAYAKRNGRIRQ